MHPCNSAHVSPIVILYIRSAPPYYTGGQRNFMQTQNTISEVNFYAMRNGIWLGLWGLLSLVALRFMFSLPVLSSTFMLMTVASPVIGGLLTFRYRKAVGGNIYGFSFFQGFLHALFMGFYAALWVALGTFVYLNWLDHGAFFAAYQENLNQSMARPEMAQIMQDPALQATINEATNGKGIDGIGELMQSMGAVTYASMPIYAALIIGPFISIFIGLACMKRPSDTGLFF